jgi:hypothetical protein
MESNGSFDSREDDLGPLEGSGTVSEGSSLCPTNASER